MSASASSASGHFGNSLSHGAISPTLRQTTVVTVSTSVSPSRGDPVSPHPSSTASSSLKGDSPQSTTHSSDPTGQAQDPQSTSSLALPSVPSSTSPIALPEETTTSSFDPMTSASAFSGMIVSTIVTASTDSTSGVHTYTEITTIASFKALPTHGSGRDTRQAGGGSSSSPNVGVIIMGVMGGVVACALALLAIWWLRRRQRTRIRYNYQFTGYGPESPKSPTWGQRFGRPLGRRSRERLDSGSVHTVGRFTIGSFGNSQERITTPTPFYGQRSTDSLTVKPASPSLHVQSSEPSRDASDLEGRAQPRNREGLTQRDRPPTYHTTSTGVATIATTLPQYSMHDPSPISEHSGLPDIPTTSSVSVSPLSGRHNPRRTGPGFTPLTPIGEKF